jgi:hypothetical protein
LLCRLPRGFRIIAAAFRTTLRRQSRPAPLAFSSIRANKAVFRNAESRGNAAANRQKTSNMNVQHIVQHKQLWLAQTAKNGKVLRAFGAHHPLH